MQETNILKYLKINSRSKKCEVQDKLPSFSNCPNIPAKLMEVIELGTHSKYMWYVLCIDMTFTKFTENKISHICLFIRIICNLETLQFGNTTKFITPLHHLRQLHCTTNIQLTIVKKKIYLYYTSCAKLHARL